MLESWTEIAGLLAALCWSLGGLIFSRIPASAGAINLGKNLIGLVILAGLVLFRPDGRASLVSLDPEPFLWLAASAVVGILIGDASYLRSLQLLGPRRTLVLSTLGPIFSGLVGWFFLAELLGPGELGGIALTLVGVTIVIRERSPSGAESPGVGHSKAGILHGINAAACQAVGAALSKKGMVELAPLDATLVRLVVASLGGIVLALVARRLGRWVSQLRAPGVPARIGLASFLGTVLGIWLSLVAIRDLPVAVATTQTSTTPIFMTVLVVLILRERVSLRAWLGTTVAMLGVVALILASAPSGS